MATLKILMGVISNDILYMISLKWLMVALKIVMI